MVVDRPGWTELAGLWGNSGREVCAGTEPDCALKMAGFDCDNGSEFINTAVKRHAYHLWYCG